MTKYCSPSTRTRVQLSPLSLISSRSRYSTVPFSMRLTMFVLMEPSMLVRRATCLPVTVPKRLIISP